MKKRIILSLICGTLVFGLTTGCNNDTSNIDKDNSNDSNEWNDYIFYINDYKMELPMSFEKFNQLITEKSDYELGNSEKFYNGFGIDDDKLISGESEEFYYLNQHGDTIFDQYYLHFTLKNETDATLPNEDCTVVGIRVGNLVDPINGFDKNIKFTSEKLYTGIEITEKKLVDTFGNYDDFSASTYRYDKFVHGWETNYSFQISIRDNVISQLQINWIDKTVEE